MNVKFSNYPQKHGNSFIGGVKTELDGVELLDVRDVSLHCPADGYAVLSVDINVSRPLEIELDAQVTVNFHVMPGMRAVYHTDAAGRMILTCEPE